MIKLKKVTFEYEDGTETIIDNPRGALLFQSRINSSGVLSGMEQYMSIKFPEDNVEEISN